MAKMAGPQAGLLDAVRALGIDPNTVRKLIIEIEPGAPAVLHVQGCADHGALGVVKALDGDIQVVREDPA
jgi:hypothetical protein